MLNMIVADILMSLDSVIDDFCDKNARKQKHYKKKKKAQK